MPDDIKGCQSWTAVIHADFKHRAAAGIFAVSARRPSELAITTCLVLQTGCPDASVHTSPG